MADSEKENNHYKGFSFLIMVITLLAMGPTLFIRIVLYLFGFGPRGPVAGKYL
jgi:hypothetical protein